MSRSDSLGEFEQLVLLAIVRLGGGAYGTTIRREIEQHTARTIAVGALYTALERLERKGFVGSSMRIRPATRRPRETSLPPATGRRRGAQTIARRVDPDVGRRGRRRAEIRG